MKKREVDTDKVVYWVAAVAVATVVLVGQPTAAGTIHFVDDDATGGNDGSSWINAFADLQDALAAAQAGGEIRVAQGRYTPAGANGGRDATFQLTDKVIVKGGYAGIGEPDPDKRDVHEYRTILSGDLNGDDGPGFVNMDENVLHVVSGAGLYMTASLEGVTITGGNANGGGAEDSSGGGVFNRYGSIRIVDCALVGNWADRGGGMYCYWESDNTEITRCTFAHNYATGGGGLNISRTSAVISNCVFAENQASDSGGAVLTEDNSPRFENCLFVGNSAGRVGGGFSGFGSDTRIVNCTFTGNTSGEYGGAVGSGLESGTTIVNSILWGNDAPAGSQVYVSAPHYMSDLVISFSNIEGARDGLYVDERADLVWGEGNINADPCFVVPWRLGPVSYWKFDEGEGVTAYDSAGDNHGNVCGDAEWTMGKIGGALSFDGWDDYVIVEHDGNARIANGVVDMGAFEAPAVIQADLRIVPRVINRNNRRARVIARVRLPENVTIDQIDRKQALVLLPGEIEAERQYFFSIGRPGRKVVYVFAFFDKGRLMQAVPEDGDVQLTVTGKLNDGRIYSGTDTVAIVGRTQPPRGKPARGPRRKTDTDKAKAEVKK